MPEPGWPANKADAGPDAPAPPAPPRLAPLWLERAVLAVTDALFALHPAPRPDPGRLRRCRVISHRGQRDAPGLIENTVPAFERLRGGGVDGIEFDVRWTRDTVPVVFHDADLVRLFGDAARIADLDWAELHRRRPEIPDLHGFVRRFVDEFHLMVELKCEPYPQPELMNRRLAEALAPALERDRAHVLCMMPALLDALPAIPPRRTLGIARLNPDEISREAQARGRAGITGHYALLRPRHLAVHRAAGQVIGTGFPDSRAVLWREAARGVDYVFGNDALQLVRWRREGGAD